MLLAVISKQKSDLCSRFKLELVKTTHLGFVVKVLWKCYERKTSQKVIFFFLGTLKFTKPDVNTLKY